MTYAAYEASPESGQPVELYRFTIGTTVYRYTSADEDYVFEATTFVPRQISRSSPAQSTEEKQQQLEVTLPANDDIALRFIGVVPGEVMSLEVIRVHRNDPDQEGIAFWEGRVTGASYQDNATKCVMLCRTSESATSRSIPRYKFQGICNHILYDSSCQVVPASFDYAGEVIAEASRQITVDGLSAMGADWAVGGYVATANDYRLVMSQSGDVLTLLIDFAVNLLGSTVTVFAGCDHNFPTCRDKFSNSINFGGFPFVPTRNPFTSGID